MRRLLNATATIAVVLANAAGAQDSTLTVTAEAAVGLAVIDKALSGAAESFPAGTKSVVCFSRVTGAANSEIEHVWYKGDTEVARKALTIGSSPFRTWSIKSIPADGAGDWRCDVMHNGKVLQSVKFKVE